jgi:hypothetical protein
VQQAQQFAGPYAAVGFRAELFATDREAHPPLPPAPHGVRHLRQWAVDAAADADVGVREVDGAVLPESPDGPILACGEAFHPLIMPLYQRDGYRPAD